MTDRHIFKLVDANTPPTKDNCGCAGHGPSADSNGEDGHGTSHGNGGCGCGGHGKGHGQGRGKRAHEMAVEPIESTAGSCGCGGHGQGHGQRAGHEHPGGAGVIHAPGADELVIHSIPRVVRHAVLFAAVDALPVGENLQICAPHQPEPLFAHLKESEQHYRVETLEVGPVDWRYRITRLA